MKKGNKVIVHDGNFEKALRKFNKIVSESGVIQTLLEKQFYVKPTIQRKIAKNKAVKRWQKKLRSDALPKKMY